MVLALGLTLLWSGRQRFEFNSFQATLLSALEFASFVVSIVTLGWLGVGILVGVNLAAASVWSLILAAKKQSTLVQAAVQSSDMTAEDADGIWHWMGTDNAFAAIRPLERADLIRDLAKQARSPSEIRPMAKAVAQLSVIFDCEADWLVPHFDQLLRLYGKRASDSEEVADMLVTATKQSATTFEDMLIAMIIAGGGSDGEGETLGESQVAKAA